MQLQEHSAVIYVRKSTLDDGKSIADQERECRTWCDANKVKVEKVFTDQGISASRYGTRKRDAWTALKGYLRTGHILVAWEASRAARDIEEWAAFRNLCAQHEVPFAYNGRVLDLTSGDDRFVGGLDALMAEREAEQIRERTMRGKRGAALDGTPAARPPWGYRPVPRLPGTRPQWEPDPVEAPRVREAALRIIRGESFRSVRKWLAATGYAPATTTGLARVLRSPTLAGRRVHQGKIVGPATWEAILTEDEHQQLLSAALRATQPLQGPEPKYLCSGIAVCDVCESKIRKLARKEGKYNRKPVYTCPNGCVSRRVEILDEAVERAVMRRLRSVNPVDYQADDPMLAEVRRRIAVLEADLKSWRAKALAEEVDAEMYASIEKDRKAKIAALTPARSEPPAPLPTAEAWASGSLQEKRQTLRALLVVRVPKIGRRRATIDDVFIRRR